jgi:hypothetical protein
MLQPPAQCEHRQRNAMKASVLDDGTACWCAQLNPTRAITKNSNGTFKCIFSGTLEVLADADLHPVRLQRAAAGCAAVMLHLTGNWHCAAQQPAQAADTASQQLPKCFTTQQLHGT